MTRIYDVDVSISQRSELFLVDWAAVLPEVKSYKEIWGKEWISLDELNWVVENIHKHGPTFEVENTTVHIKTALIPSLPERSRLLFYDRCNLALNWRWPTWEPILKEFLGQMMTPSVLAAVRTELHLVEMQARAEGKPELWQLAAIAFGLPFR